MLVDHSAKDRLGQLSGCCIIEHRFGEMATPGILVFVQSGNDLDCVVTPFKVDVNHLATGSASNQSEEQFVYGKPEIINLISEKARMTCHANSGHPSQNKKFGLGWKL